MRASASGSSFFEESVKVSRDCKLNASFLAWDIDIAIIVNLRVILVILAGYTRFTGHECERGFESKRLEKLRKEGIGFLGSVAGSIGASFPTARG